jgi:hypothetical protein
LNNPFHNCLLQIKNVDHFIISSIPTYLSGNCPTDPIIIVCIIFVTAIIIIGNTNRPEETDPRNDDNCKPFPDSHVYLPHLISRIGSTTCSWDAPILEYAVPPSDLQSGAARMPERATGSSVTLTSPGQSARDEGRMLEDGDHAAEEAQFWGAKDSQSEVE